ncbi:MAG: hypothetical protein K6L76_03325 [Agarilytica sp.]
MRNKLTSSVMLGLMVSGCSVSFSGVPPIPEVIELSDGTFKVYVAHQSKTQVVKTSKGFMNKTCDDKNMKYLILSETIAMTGEVASEAYKQSKVTIFDISRTESEYTPKHMHEGEFHFQCNI